MSTYKRPAILEKQLRSILLQDYSNFEIIVSDNDPEASAQIIVDQIADSRIKYFNNIENLGMVRSFNKSIERSSGDYIVMITDDDPVYVYMLSTLIALQSKYPGYGVYAGCGDLIIENDFSANSLGQQLGTNSNLLKDIPENAIIEKNKDEIIQAYLDGLFSKTYLLWSCAIIKRDIIIKIKGMPDYGSELLTDHAFMLAASSFEGLIFINKSLGGQVIHGNNFGFDFTRLKQKYINTPALFHGYLKTFLQQNPDWGTIEKKIWDFAGRSWAEYSIMIYNTVKDNKELKKDFFNSLHIAFSNKNISKWKYKFYLKVYFKGLFNVLLKIKELISKK
ncbi:glycosyltransferase [Ferruginibacter lapsinanis]|uniref:glycosyltransferase family 2 protein n=1 Tax=Ferruginibacter lapsinanis TaxID=563172 RepID=UPI001E3C4685|nr:glycosyltransferase family A protein [Ferruginibacter lapsinanis]UEG49051.1 glycosyltransferase [Ferruginibacter lapsinanis]